MFPTLAKVDPAELTAIRRVNAHISKRKWHAAYLAVDQLLYLRAKKRDAATPFITIPVVMTSLLEYRLERSLRRLQEQARQLP